MDNIKRKRKSTGNKSNVPVTTLWNNARMIRTHSIRVACREILNMANHLDVVKINIVGNPSTGKSTLAYTLGHILHKESKTPFTVKIFDRKDLLNFRDTMEKLESTNYILIFDDVSFLQAGSSKSKIMELQQAFTEIRHLPGKQDVKIITIFNFHYTMAVSKYLRQSDAHFYTTIGQSDIDNVLKLVGVKYSRKILDFIRITKQAVNKSKFVFQLGNKGRSFVYDFRQPFAPAFFYNGDTARFVVFPKREWIDKICPVCNRAAKIETTTLENIESFDTAIQTKFGTGVVKQALRLKLYINGISTYSKPVKRALTFIDKWNEKNQVSLDMLADFYGLKDEQTKLRVPSHIFEPSTKE